MRGKILTTLLATGVFAGGAMAQTVVLDGAAPVVGEQQIVTTTETTQVAPAQVDGERMEENAAVGGVGGAAMGALIGGPVGAVAGAIIGGSAGAVASVEPSEEVTTYVTTTTVEPVYLEGTVSVGAGVPDVVELYEIPESVEYRYARINDQVVLVDPGSRQIVYIYE